MKTLNIVLCGLGGQGILFMSKVLAQAALDKGYPILGSETHGMAQRGGSVVSHIRVGETKSSLVRTGSADLLLALEENEGYRNLPFLAKEAGFFVNSDSNPLPRAETKVFLDKNKIQYHAIPAGKLALELGAPRSSNLALLGHFSRYSTEPATQTELRATIEKLSPEKFKKLNLKIFDAGFEYGK
jgi:indolepyruvate ferredoxin oxidoreductase beta subunit